MMKKVLIAGLIALPLTAMAAQLSTDAQQAGYAMGYQIGKALKDHNQVVDSSSFEAGFDDGYSGKPGQMTEAAQDKVLRKIQQQAMKQMATKMKSQADANLKAGQDFLTANAKKPGVKTLANGLQYKVLKAGTGPSPTLNSVVTVSYQGSLINGKVFDSSATHGGPATFTLKNVIPGWQQLIPMMKQGGEWMLFIPAKYAYGEQGAAGLIGPNSTLIFKVKLVKVKS